MTGRGEVDRADIASREQADAGSAGHAGDIERQVAGGIGAVLRANAVGSAPDQARRGDLGRAGTAVLDDDAFGRAADGGRLDGHAMDIGRCQHTNAGATKAPDRVPRLDRDSRAADMFGIDAIAAEAGDRAAGRDGHGTVDDCADNQAVAAREDTVPAAGDLGDIESHAAAAAENLAVVDLNAVAGDAPDQP